MLYNTDIICISSIDWDFVWQGHQEIMSTLADNGNRILFIENTGVRTPGLRDLPRLKKRIKNWLRSVKGIRKEKENLYIYSPLILPFPYSKIARFINRHLLIPGLMKWIKSSGFSKPIIWTFLPTGLVLDVIDAVDNRLVIYYCIDNFSASSPQAKKIRNTEKTLIADADIVFVTSKKLHDLCSQYNTDVHIFSYGINTDIYKKASDAKMDVPEDMAAIKHPIVGYVGGVHKWIDFKLVKFLASVHPDKSFAFVGPIQTDVSELADLKNIYFLGQKAYDKLPSYVSQFDICLIPYLITEYTNNVYPTKINEYLALGKPVVSTPIPEVESFNERNNDVVFIGRTKEHFSSIVGETLSGKDSDEVRHKRMDIAIQEGSWKAKIDNMSSLIEKKISSKEKEISLKWKDNLLKLYKKSKRKLIPVAGGLLLIYLTIFYTPLLWFIARPLKVSTPLEKADVIIALAGGVGESGKAGQGYEERVQYAVELYKKGYASNIILSSGFRYAIKEAEVMKALAVSLGVPEASIILEENARNTYENVKFSSDILLKKDGRRAILISSPYHMKRLSLVCKKVAPNIYFIYAPIPSSIFYGKESGVQAKHIFAIFHEYLGIIYYFFKGYI